MSATKIFETIEEFEQHQGPKQIKYNRNAAQYFTDKWQWVCEHCSLDECARPAGRDQDLTLSAQRRFALLGCTISIAGAKGVDEDYVQEHPEEFGLLSEAELQEKWG